MAQFAVHTNPSAASRDRVPYLVDVQCNLLDGLATRMVIPLLRSADGGRPVEILNPLVEIDGETFLLSTAEMAGVPITLLGEEVASLERERDAIVAAIDLLITGI